METNKLEARIETDNIAKTFGYTVDRWCRVCRGGRMAVITITQKSTMVSGFVESRKGVVVAEKKAQDYILSRPTR
jgi:hypothetical protein